VLFEKLSSAGKKELMRLRILFSVLIAVVFFVQGCGGSEPAGIDNAQITDSSGIVLFTDAGTGEEVSVLVVDQTNEPVEGIQVDFVDGDGFETFVAFDPDGEMLPSLSIFPHNSTHTIQMAMEDALPVILELLPGSDEYETVMLFADFLDDFAEQGEAPTGGPDVPENWLYRGVSTPEELEQENKLFLMLLKATPLRPAVEITERGGKLLDILYAMDVVEEPDAYHSWVIVPSLGDSENLAGSIFMLSPIYDDQNTNIDASSNEGALDVSANAVVQNTRFTIDDQNIITDNVTELQWMVGSDTSTDWYESESWVNSLGGTWRMPSISEFWGLYDAGINYEYWGPFSNSGWYVWSSEVQDSSSAWFFSFTGTEVDGNRSLSENFRAFAVRSPKNQLDLPLEALSCGIEIGTPDEEVISILGQPESKNDRTFYGADGRWSQHWSYSNGDMVIYMSSDDEHGDQTVSQIRLTGQSTYRTSSGLGIGDTESDVIAEHDSIKDQAFSRDGEFFVAGSIYGGVGFGISSGVVVSITIGAMAE